MTRRDSWILLAVFGSGVFLAGLELMITAVALPTILTDLVDPAREGESAWSELRHASWIVNGYLLAYIVAMPLAGRLADLWGARRLFLISLTIFVIGSFLAGRAMTLDELIAGRIVQGVGGGFLVPVGTAAASHLFEGHDRPRALGVIGALTFLGMAAGPFVGAAILSSIHVEQGFAAAGLDARGLVDLLSPAWRWVFYINVPIGLATLAIGWAASYGWETPRRRSSVDVVGAVIWSAALIAGLGALTLIGSESGVAEGFDPVTLGLLLAGIAVVATALTVIRGLRRTDPFLDPRLFKSVPFSSATLVSGLTGYAFATVIIGGAVFVDRVLYGGPDDQRLALGALAGATAVGALVSGFLVRALSLRLVTLIGLLASMAALVWMSRWTSSVEVPEVAAVLAVFGLGFGLTVTPRSTAAVEAAGRASFGMASAIVTVARMVGMAVGVAILTAYGSTIINSLYDRLLANDGWQALLPPELAGRPFRDPLVIEVLETWAAGQAAEIMVGLFLVAAAVMAVAIVPGLALGERSRMLGRGETAPDAAAAGGAIDGRDDVEPTFAL